SKLISLERRIGRGKEIPSVTRIVPQIFESRSMQIIGSGLSNHVDYRAAREPVLGIVLSCKYLNFLHALNRGHDTDVCILRLAIENSFDVYAIRIRVHTANRT